jgi:hypothetical protein
MYRTMRSMGGLFLLMAVGCDGNGDCCSGPECESGVPLCPIECSDGSQCSGGQFCAIAPDGNVSGCVASCDAERVCAGDRCCPAGSVCESGECASTDLAIGIDGPESVTFSRHEVVEGACSVDEGWDLGVGRRSRIHVNFWIRNAASIDLVLGNPETSSLYSPSFCAGDWVIEGLVGATLRDLDGTEVARGDLDVRCVAALGGPFDCEGQGLEAGEQIDAPVANDWIDATGVAAGRYVLELELDPDNVLADGNDANDHATVEIDYPDCDGTMCGGACCPANVECVDNVCMLPDLRANRDAIENTVVFNYGYFAEGSCEIAEGCVGGPGRRHLLQFEGRIENWGPGDLNPGPEMDNPLFEFSECHSHYHFLSFTDYRLLDTDGDVAAQGHKQSFCLVDMVPVSDDPPAPPGTHPGPGERGCSYLSAGWADIYGVGTSCQWIDVTGVPEGDYVLQVTVNPDGRVNEVSTEDNVARVLVHVPAFEECIPEPEICDNWLDEDCDGIADNGCFPTCFPYPEICDNGFDEDCDGVEDNGCEPLPGTELCTTAPLIDGASATALLSVVGTREPSCGGEGGEAFFRIDVPTEQWVYISTFESPTPAVLSVLSGGCEGAELGCARDACGTENAHWAGLLPAGEHIVHLRAPTTTDVGEVRVRVMLSNCASGTLIDEPGLYAGDTSDAAPSAVTCADDPVESPTDRYVALQCPFTSSYFSTCGSSDFASSIEVHEGTCDGPATNCSGRFDYCSGDPDGATVMTFGGSGGLTIVEVAGESADASGEYQLFVGF